MAFNFKEKIPESFLHLMPWFFFAAAFQSLLAAAALLLVPSESGISFARVGLLGVLFFFFFMGMYLAFSARQDLSRFRTFASAVIPSALLFFASGLILFLLRYLNPERFLPYYQRLSPLLWYLLALGFQSLIISLLLKYGFHPRKISERKPTYISALFAFCILLIIFLFVSITQIGITPDTGYWGEPGVAIVGWQFILSILVGFLFLLYQSRISNAEYRTYYLIPIFIYFVTLALWLTVPLDVLQNSFYAPITSPVNIPLPYSDAGYYDYLSQSLLIGTDYLGGIPPRPLYVVFLAFLHFIFGQNYPAIIAAQTCVLALFPVTLYFLGKKLHSPAAGVAVALFAIFRELASLWISSNTRTANSKMFTTDFPTALALALLCLVIIYWLERRDLKSTLFAGGFVGLVLLFRTQSLLVLPVIFVLAWFVYQRKTKDWAIAGLVFAIPLILTITPWLTHNYVLTGKFTFDNSGQMATLYSQYAFSGNNDLSQFDPAKDNLRERIISFTLENPAYVSTFIAAHFLNIEIGGLLSLPLIKRFDGLSAPVNLYWVAWDGTIEGYNFLLLIVYLAVIAVGIGSAWRRMRWLGLLPLAVNIGYAFSTAIARFSSWRYNLPVDWVVYFYFAIGIMELLGAIILLFGSHLESGRLLPDKRSAISIRDFRLKYFLFILAFMFVGATPWLAKGLVSQRFTSTQEQLIVKLQSSGYDPKEIQTFLSQPDALLVEGRMLYPRMYRRDEGISSAHPWEAYKTREYPRIGFVLINEKYRDAIFPTKELLNFPQGADVVALACKREDHLEIRVIVFGNESFESAPLSQLCTKN